MTTPKFGNDATVEALYVMSVAGWFTGTSGDVESPTGWFAWTEIRDNELAEISEAFDGFPEIVETDDDLSNLLTSLVGGWILYEDSQGFVDAVEYPLPFYNGSAMTASDARKAFEALEAEYAEWAGDE